MAWRSVHTWSIGLVILAGLAACNKSKSGDDETSDKGKKAQTSTARPADTSTGTDKAPADTSSPGVPGGYAVGNHVAVLWRGTWYAATILAVQGDRYKIHYTGWGSEWDEMVGTDRIRPAGGVTQPTTTTTTTATGPNNGAMCYPDCAIRTAPYGQQCCPPQMCQNDAQCGGRACCMAPGGHAAQCLSSCTAGWTHFNGTAPTPTTTPPTTTKPTTTTRPPIKTL